MQSKEKICKLLDNNDIENKILGLQLLLNGLDKSNALYWYFKLAVWLDEDINNTSDERFNTLTKNISIEIDKLVGNRLLPHNDNLHLFQFVNNNFDKIDIDSLSSYISYHISNFYFKLSNKSNKNHKQLTTLKTKLINSLSNGQSNESNKDL